MPKTPVNAEVTGDGGLKAPDAKPEPLVGAGISVGDPIKDVRRTADLVEQNTDLRVHGAPAVVDLAVDRAVEATQADEKDFVTSGEAVDQGNTKLASIEGAELDAASHAEQLALVEDKFGADTAGLAIRAAGDKEGDHVKNVKKAAKAIDTSKDSPGDTSAAQAFEALDSLDRVESPHGRNAEKHDPWQAARWAPHGDMNVPDVSYGPGKEAKFGRVNPTAHDQIRGLEGDSDADVKKAKKEAGPGVDLQDERDRANKEARKVAKSEKVDYSV